MNVYIKLEIKAREFESRLLLALCAVERGHTVYIGAFPNILRRFLKPGIFHEKSITPKEERIKELLFFRDNNFICTSQDEESGLLNYDFVKEIALTRFSKETLSLVFRQFSWGDYDDSLMKKTYPEFSDRIIKTGSPRVDLWRKDLSSFYVDKKIEEFKDLILISSNFNSIVGNQPMHSAIEYERNAGYFNFDRGGEEFERTKYGVHAFNTQMLMHFIFAIRRLSKKYPEASIVVRPHPVENIDAWKALLGKIDNVYVVRKGSIGSWVKHAKVVIHNGCTTGFEAKVMGKNVLAYKPISSEYEFATPNKVSTEIFTEEDLIEVVGDILNGDGIKKSKNKELEACNLIRSMFCNLDGSLAADKIVGEWEKIKKVNELSQKNGIVKLRIILLGLLFINMVGNIKLNLKRLLYFFNSPSKQTDLENEKFPKFNNKEIEDTIMGFQGAVNRFDNIHFSKISSRMIILGKL